MNMNWKAIGFIGLILLVWQIGTEIGFANPALFPSPIAVLIAGADWFYTGQLLTDMGTSIGRLLAGLVLGSVFGVLIGLAMGRILFLDETVAPLLHILRAFPPVAIIPLIIVWLGIGDIAKIFSIAFAVFFPVWISALIGAKSIPKEYLKAAKIYSKSRQHTFTHVVIPATIPFLINGLRIGIGVGFIMVFVSELAGSSSGLGYFIASSQIIFRIDAMIAGLMVLGLLSAFTDYLLVSIIHKKWQWADPK